MQALDGFPKDKHIIDLAAGQGTDTLEYLRAGWTVIAVDSSKVGLWLAKRKAKKAGKGNNISCIQSSLEDYRAAPCAGVNASFALPFCSQSHWPDFWASITKAIIPGGVFAGQFFGLEDTWQNKPLKGKPTLHFSESDVRDFFKDFEILDFKEVNQTGSDPYGKEKHWQVYHVLAKKK